MSEQDRAEVYTENTEEVEFFQEIVNLLEGTVIMTAQALNRIEYSRRFNVLNTLIENTGTVNELIKSHDKTMSIEGDELFGEKFRENLTKNSIAKKDQQKYLQA